MNQIQKSIILIGILILFSQFGCAKKKTETLNARTLKDKQVALAEVRGPKDGVTMVEVAIVNEILDNARFTIIDKTTVKEALSTYPAENDRQRLGKKVGADYVLWVDVSEFKVSDREGYDNVTEEDSVMTEEQRSDKPIVSKRYQKIKESEGIVRLHWNFLNVQTGETIYKGTGEAREKYNSRDKFKSETKVKEPALSSGKLALLERVTAKAVADFFSKLPQ